MNREPLSLWAKHSDVAQRYTALIDSLMIRILFLPPHSEQNVTRPADRAFNASLLLSGTRCIVQYVLLPFVLPLVGFAADLSVWLSMAIDLVALGALVFSLRRLWRTRAPQRWRYLPLALLMALAISVFLWHDVRFLLAQLV